MTLSPSRQRCLSSHWVVSDIRFPASIDVADDDPAELLRQAEKGDEVAWNVIVERYSGLLWSVARGHRLGAADAADVVQTTWLRLVEHLSAIREPERLTSWLVTTARRESLRVVGMAHREDIGGVEQLTASLPDEKEAPIDEGLLLDERDAMLWRCFGQLPERCQVLLRTLMSSPAPTYAEVSLALDLPVGSIGPTRGRCLDRLRDLAEPAGLGGVQ
jgi:RNA polymerase sigma factor (sigma-70 family)